MLATLIVNSAADNITSGDGLVTLREAIIAANTDTVTDLGLAGFGVDTIRFAVNIGNDPGDDFATPQTIFLGLGEFEITEAATIEGPGQQLLTIDAQQNSRVLNFSSISGDFTLNGLTLTGGRASDLGGGIHFNSADALALSGSTVSGNSATGSNAKGGGISAVFASSVSLTSSTVSGNNTMGDSSGGGGGIFTQFASVSLTSSTVSGNSTTGGNPRGGGIFTYSGNVSLTSSTVSGNSSSYQGGGIRTFIGSVSLTSSTVSGNSSGAGGGGIYTLSGSVSLMSSTVSGNFTTDIDAEGGGIRTLDGSVSLTSSTVSGNSATFLGGGILTRHGSVSLTSSTVSGNSALVGGGVYVDNTSTNSAFVIENSIVAGNTGTILIPDLKPDQLSTLTINHSLIGATVLTIGGTGNLVGTIASPINPLLGPLADNGGPTKTHALLPGSPAIDAAGTPSPVFDQRGEPFFRSFDDPSTLGTGIDMGAYERQTLPGLVFDTLVDEDDGDYTAGDLSLREAIDLTRGSVGAVTITFDAALFATPQTMLLELGEIELTEAVTIEGPGQELLTIDALQNSRIFNITATTGDFTLAGLTLTGGRTIGDNVNFADTTFSGGAIRSLTTGNLTIDQSTVSGNSTEGNSAGGGGIYSSGVVTLTSSTVSGNSTEGNFADGGGISSLGTVTLTNSTVSGNSTAGPSRGYGGGIFSNFGSVTLTNSTVSDNSSGGDGGGIQTTFGNVTLTNSTVNGNSGGDSGGGIRTDFGDVTLTSSTVSGNSAINGGGGIHVNFGGVVTLINSAVNGNSGGAYGGGIRAAGGAAGIGGHVTLISSTVSDNSTTLIFAEGGGIFATSGDVTLISSTVSGNSSSAAGGGISARSGDVTLTSSTVSGNSTAGNSADGGGIYSSGVVTLTSSTVSGNSTAGSDADGGGIFSLGDVTLTSSTVSGNSTTGSFADGGGFFSGGNITLISSTVSGNSMVGNFAFGGGIYSSYGTVTLTSSTVTKNRAVYSNAKGGGIFNYDGTITIANSIVAGNTAGGGSPDINPGTGTLNIDFSLIEQVGLTITGGDNIIGMSANLGPLANNGGPTETHALLAGSLALDAGDPTILFDANQFDQRGAPFVRVFDDPIAAGTGIDIGAYERQTVASLNLVVDTPVDENDGVYSVGNLSLREAVGLANGSIGDNTITFDAAVFATPQTILLGLGEIEISEALTIDATSLTSNVTIDAQQQSRIFHITAATGDFTLAGLNLTGGRTTGDSAAFATTFNGGAIRSLTLGNLTLDQSTVSGNSTTGIGADGGGIFSSTVTLTSSTVSGNSTAGDNADGGGIRSSTATLTSSTVSGNSTAGSFARGGGIRSGGAITLTSSTVSGNSTTGSTAEGGGISSGGAIMLTSSTVSGNSTTGYNADGGGVFSYRTVTLISSTVSGNSTMGNRASGGGISSNGGGFSDGAVTLISSTVSGNSTASSNAAGGGIFSDGAVSLTRSTVTDNQANGSTGGGIRNYNHPISITNSIVAGNTAGGGMNDINPGTGTFSVNYSLIGTGVSPDAGTSGNNAVTNNPMLGALADNGGPTETHALLAGSLALDMGDLAASPGVGNVPLFDQRGNNFGRVQNGRIDIGAFEVRETLSADFDTDGFITGFDFLLWQRGFGTAAPGATKPDGDADNDQDADGNDLDVWKSQFGQPAPAVATTSSLVVESSLAVEPSSAFQVEVTTALTSTSEESVASRLPDNFIVSPSDLGLGFRFTAPRQVLVRTKAITEHAFTEHVDEAFHGVWNSLPEQILEFASDDFVLATHGRSAKATQLADKAFAELADDEGFVGLVLPL